VILVAGRDLHCINNCWVCDGILRHPSVGAKVVGKDTLITEMMSLLTYRVEFHSLICDGYVVKLNVVVLITVGRT
jgi:hypothetical protein